MGPDTLALMIPIVAIVGCMCVAAFKTWAAHREKIERMRSEQAARQAQADRELLSLGRGDVSAHLEAILDRLTAMEGRLSALEGESADQRTMTPLPIPEAEDEPRYQRQQQDTESL